MIAVAVGIMPSRSIDDTRQRERRACAGLASGAVKVEIDFGAPRPVPDAERPRHAPAAVPVAARARLDARTGDLYLPQIVV